MRECMVAARKKRGLTIAAMAKKCRCSVTLLEMLEWNEDEVTHPNIAARIAKEYKLSKRDAERLLPENYRPSSPCYDPGRYKAREDREAQGDEENP